MDEIVVRIIDMPPDIRGLCIRDGGDYNIFINGRYNFEQQREALLHELRHIKGKDFEKEGVVGKEEWACPKNCIR